MVLKSMLKAIQAILKSLPVTLVALVSMFYCAYTAMVTAARTAQVSLLLHTWLAFSAPQFRMLLKAQDSFMV